MQISYKVLENHVIKKVFKFMASLIGSPCIKVVSHVLLILSANQEWCAFYPEDMISSFYPIIYKKWNKIDDKDIKELMQSSVRIMISLNKSYVSEVETKIRSYDEDIFYEGNWIDIFNIAYEYTDNEISKGKFIADLRALRKKDCSR